MTSVATLRHIVAARIEIAERVEEAFDTLARLPDRTKATLGTQTLQWPLVVRRMFEDAPRGTACRRPPPPAEQITRMEDVLTWMVALGAWNRNWAKAVYLICGRRRTVVSAAKVIGCDRHSARAWCDNGLDYIVAWQSSRDAA